MCKFFSCISNGKGKVLFFKLEEIMKIEKIGQFTQSKLGDFNA